MPRYAKLMIGFGVFLIVCGVIGWGASGFAATAKTAIIVSGATGVLMIIMGLLSAHPGHIVKMIGIHLGLIFPILYAIVFGLRAYKSYGAGPEKLYLAILLTVMAVASVIVFFLLLRMRPKPSERGATTPEV